VVDIGSTPQFEAPVLADLYRKLVNRPYWAKTDPLAVDQETFKTGLREMADIQRRRGFPVVAANIEKTNFLLYGIPIVMLDG
jgi:hypothetical protein